MGTVALGGAASYFALAGAVLGPGFASYPIQILL